MSFPRDLIDQAKHLASRDAARPKQASLRRAISSAYYGLFHLLAEDTAFNFAPSTPSGLRETVQRVLAHADMKNVCKVFVGGNNAFKKSQKPGIPTATQKILSFPLEDDLIFVMNAFIDLQESRHLADYDSTVRFPSDFSDLGYITFKDGELSSKALDILKELVALELVKVSAA